MVKPTAPRAAQRNKEKYENKRACSVGLTLGRDEVTETVEEEAG